MCRIIAITTLIILLLTLLGCSSGSHGLTTPPDTQASSRQLGGHNLAGLWQFRINPDAKTIDVIPIRSGDLHMNVVSLLESPPYYLVSLEGAPHFGQGNVTVNIGITHPATGIPRLTGFDVKGILIGNGVNSLFDVPQLIYAGESDIRLNNADGWTRWWNPTEFPYNAADETQGYIDGKLGLPDDTAGFTATLNPYKYFCDSLGATDDISTLPTDDRGVFSAGAKNVRQYVIDFTPSGLVFNYAVDANWMPPMSNPPVIPDDFPPGANQPEPYRVVIHETANTLKYNTTTGVSSGTLFLDVDLYSWYNAGASIVCNYSANGEISGTCNYWPSGGTFEYSIYELEGNAIDLSGSSEVLVWIAAECQDPSGFNDILPWEVQGNLFPYWAPVQQEG